MIAGSDRSNKGKVVCDSRTSHKSMVLIEEVGGQYRAYPLGLKGAVEGKGGSRDEALEAMARALKSHIAGIGRTIL